MLSGAGAPRAGAAPQYPGAWSSRLPWATTRSLGLATEERTVDLDHPGTAGGQLWASLQGPCPTLSPEPRKVYLLRMAQSSGFHPRESQLAGWTLPCHLCQPLRGLFKCRFIIPSFAHSPCTALSTYWVPAPPQAQGKHQGIRQMRPLPLARPHPQYRHRPGPTSRVSPLYPRSGPRCPPRSQKTPLSPLLHLPGSARQTSPWRAPRH